MGLLRADWLLPLLPDHDEDDHETGPIGTAPLVQPTTALEVRIEGDRAVYGDEIDVEFGGWGRSLSAELVRQRHDWYRLECHAKDPRIAAGDGLVVAEVPFAGRRRYRWTSFRPALTKHKKPHFSDEYLAVLREARKARRTDLVTLAVRELENPGLLPEDPFNTGKKRIAGVLPCEPFAETHGDRTRQRRGRGTRGATQSGGLPEALTYLAIGTCREMAEAYRLVRIGLFRKIEAEAARQAKSDGSIADGELRYASPPKGTFRGRRALSASVANGADDLIDHVAWVAMAGLGPGPDGKGEKMPKDRSVAEVAFRRLNDLLYDRQRREDEASRTKPIR